MFLFLGGKVAKLFVHCAKGNQTDSEFSVSVCPTRPLSLYHIQSYAGRLNFQCFHYSLDINCIILYYTIAFGRVCNSYNI